MQVGKDTLAAQRPLSPLRLFPNDIHLLPYTSFSLVALAITKQSLYIVAKELFP